MGPRSRSPWRIEMIITVQPLPVRTHFIESQNVRCSRVTRCITGVAHLQQTAAISVMTTMTAKTRTRATRTSTATAIPDVAVQASVIEVATVTAAVDVAGAGGRSAAVTPMATEREILHTTRITAVHTNLVVALAGEEAAHAAPALPVLASGMGRTDVMLAHIVLRAARRTHRDTRMAVALMRISRRVSTNLAASCGRGLRARHPRMSRLSLPQPQRRCLESEATLP